MKKFKLVETLRDKSGDVFQAVTFFNYVTKENLKKTVVDYAQRNRRQGMRYLYRITECKIIKPSKLILFNNTTRI